MPYQVDLQLTAILAECIAIVGLSAYLVLTGVRMPAALTRLAGH